MTKEEMNAELASFAVTRSGASVTVRCWKLTCVEPIVVRARTINLLDLLAKVEEHRLRHRP